MSTRYTFDDSHTVFEVLNHEAVVVNLDTGFYYFLDWTATDIWQALINGATVDETVAFLVERYIGDASQMQEAVRTLVTELQQEDLLIPAEAAVNGNGVTSDNGSAKVVNKKVFEQPSMVKHTDLDHVLQIEPVVDYEEAGWPTRRNKASHERK